MNEVQKAEAERVEAEAQGAYMEHWQNAHPELASRPAKVHEYCDKRAVRPRQETESDVWFMSAHSSRGRLPSRWTALLTQCCAVAHARSARAAKSLADEWQDDDQRQEARCLNEVLYKPPTMLSRTPRNSPTIALDIAEPPMTAAAMLDAISDP